MICSKFNAASDHSSKAAASAKGWDHGRPGIPGGGAFGYTVRCHSLGYASYGNSSEHHESLGVERSLRYMLLRSNFILTAARRVWPLRRVCPHFLCGSLKYGDMRITSSSTLSAELCTGYCRAHSSRPGSIPAAAGRATAGIVRLRLVFMTTGV
jgi:hypothetical protein